MRAAVQWRDRASCEPFLIWIKLRSRLCYTNQERPAPLTTSGQFHNSFKQAVVNLNEDRLSKAMTSSCLKWHTQCSGCIKTSINLVFTMVPPKQSLKYGTAEASLSLLDQNRKRHRFPRSLSQCNDGTTRISVKYLRGKNYGNRGRLRVNFIESPCVAWKLVPLMICVATGTQDGMMTAFSLLDQYVTQPAYLLRQLGMLLCLFIPLRWVFRG